jgi:hypothetical protein
LQCHSQQFQAKSNLGGLQLGAGNAIWQRAQDHFVEIELRHRKGHLPILGNELDRLGVESERICNAFQGCPNKPVQQVRLVPNHIVGGCQPIVRHANLAIEIDNRMRLCQVGGTQLGDFKPIHQHRRKRFRLERREACPAGAHRGECDIIPWQTVPFQQSENRHFAGIAAALNADLLAAQIGERFDI